MQHTTATSEARFPGRSVVRAQAAPAPVAAGESALVLGLLLLLVILL